MVRAVWGLWLAILALSPGARQPDPVRIGLLIPAGELGTAARRGAELALDAANAAGGYRGRPFELAVRTVEGLWGSGTSKITSLVFDEDVWAILGPLQGRSAHLAEQVAAKGHIALVSPWASDPTLTRANVPWFFRCVPDDRQQATALVQEIFAVRRLHRVVAVVADTYDARMAADALASAAEALASSADGNTERRDALTAAGLVRWPFPQSAEDVDALLGRWAADGIQGIVLFGPDSTTRQLLRRARAGGMRQPAFVPLSGADIAMGTQPSALGEVVVVAPGQWMTAEGRAFEREYRAAYEGPPGAVTAYAYDGLMVIVEAVRRAGLDRQRIRDALADIDYARGLTGRVRFDTTGSRVTEVTLVDIDRR